MLMRSRGSQDVFSIHPMKLIEVSEQAGGQPKFIPTINSHQNGILSANNGLFDVPFLTISATLRKGFRWDWEFKHSAPLRLPVDYVHRIPTPICVGVF